MTKNEVNEKYYCHYTSLEKFKLILISGKLRFSESTGSNDLYDTKLIYDLIKNFKSDYSNNLEENEFKDYLLRFYKNIEHKNKYYFYVCCFTDKEDSRMFWDTYAKEIVVQENEEYSKLNGICICFTKDSIDEIIGAKKVHALHYAKEAIYNRKESNSVIDNLLNTTYEDYKKLKLDPDQSQNYIKPTIKYGSEYKLKKCFVEPALEFYNKIDFYAPLFKHDFWDEENELRAVLARKYKEKENHIDMKITEGLIDHIVLGPDFTDEEEKVLKSINDCKLHYDKLKIVRSKGTGVIRSRGIEIKKRK